MGRLIDRVAIVTGAGTGIGEMCAKTLAEEGAKVIVADLDFDGATRVSSEIAASGGEATAVLVDISDEASIIALYATVRELWGPADVLVNNAAATSGEQIFRDVGIAEMDAAIWDRAFAVNARGTMLMIKHAIPGMLDVGSGSIINMSSGASLMGDYYPPAYGSSKAAVNMLTQYVATQYGKQNIRCNAVAPGLILTPTAEANRSSLDQFKLYEDNALTPYLGKPEDIAATVLFLASSASRFITAQVIRVDGGYTSHMPHSASSYAGFAANPGRRPG
jgi:NAD(P)-dependent dehydrogenase (short-subunit alcohol dehydrogenase family)